MFAVEIHLPANFATIAPDIEQDIDKWEKELAYRIPDEARRLMDESKPSGRVYRRGAMKGRRTKAGIAAGLRAIGKTQMITGSRFHRASAPGQPPAEDTGRLYRDITVRRMAKGNYRVRFGAGYAEYLEFKLNRPFVMPAIEAAVQKTFANSKI